MSQPSPRPADSRAPQPREGRGVSPIAIAVLAGIFLILFAVAYKKLQAPAAPSAGPPVASNDAAGRQAGRDDSAPHATPSIEPLGSPPVPVVATPSPPLPDPKDSLATLTSLDGKTPISPTQAAQWKRALADLVRQGQAAIPTIRGFLTNNQDVVYSSLGVSNPLGCPTLRSSLIDALAQIGGTNALDVLTQTLQSSPYPTDLLALSKALVPQGAEYQNEILGAARQQMSIASQGQLGDLDVGPLYEILAQDAAAGIDVTADLDQYASRWPYYTAITLANLPDGAGVPALIEMAQAASGSTQNPAAEALAEMAATNPDAQSTLLAMVRNNQLPDWMVGRLGPFLGGAQYEVGQEQISGESGFQTFHVAVGNQDFSFANPPNMSADQINQRINFIDQLMQALPSGGEAQQALQQERNSLAARLPPVK